MLKLTGLTSIKYLLVVVCALYALTMATGMVIGWAAEPYIEKAFNWIYKMCEELRS